MLSVHGTEADIGGREKNAYTHSASHKTWAELEAEQGT